MKKVNILVVDDRPEGILAVQAVLNSPFYNLVTASSGTEALKHLLMHDFAVILLDVQMPIMNGFETASVIKTREKSKDIPIIFMSAINQDEQYVYQGYGVGAVDYLLKPFDPYILRSKVAIFVDLFRKNELIREQGQKLLEAEKEAHAQKLDHLEVENLRRYQYLADSIPQILFRLSSTSDYEYFNRVWFEYTGFTEEMSRGQNWTKAINPDDFIPLRELLKNYTEGDVETECRILSKEGNYRWHLVRFRPERYENQEISSWLGTATDIQDRKLEEEMQTFLSQAGELLVSTLDYKTTLDTISKLAVPYLADWCTFDMFDEDGLLQNIVTYHRDPKQQEITEKLHVSFLNMTNGQGGSERVTYTGEVMIYNQITDEVRDKVAMTNEQKQLAKELGNKAVLSVPIQYHGKILGAITFGTTEPGRIYDAHKLEVAKELARRVGMAVENSRLYKLSQEAIEVRNDFLSIASHELNTPITSLKLQLQMVQKSILNNKNQPLPLERFTKAVDASVKQVDRLINLVQILLDVSRIQSGKFTFSFEALNASLVVQEVIERHKEIIANSECRINLDIPSKLDVVWDKTRIEQVITNLLTNAIKYAPGLIDLTVKEDHDLVSISVRDHGKGIPGNKLKSIFERFERVTSNESVSGLGLGLYIVKQIVEGHNGRVEVSSNEEGTQFSIHLPRDVDHVPAALLERLPDQTHWH